MSNDLGAMGPIDYIVVDFPASAVPTDGLPIIIDLVDRGVIKVLDLLLVKKELDGTVTDLDVADMEDYSELDLAVLRHPSPGLIAAADAREAGETIEPGHAAGILVYENAWAAALATVLRRSGGQLLAAGRIPVQAIQAALDEPEPHIDLG